MLLVYLSLVLKYAYVRSSLSPRQFESRSITLPPYLFDFSSNMGCEIYLGHKHKRHRDERNNRRREVQNRLAHTVMCQTSLDV